MTSLRKTKKQIRKKLVLLSGSPGFKKVKMRPIDWSLGKHYTQSNISGKMSKKDLLLVNRLK